MKTLRLVGLFVLFLALTQGAKAAEYCKTDASAQNYTGWAENPLSCDTSGNLRVSASIPGGALSLTPSSSASAGNAIVSSTAYESSHVLKASAGNFYGGQVTNQGTAGVVLIFDATSAPADGAVAPKKCYQMPSTYSTIGIAPDGPFPTVFSTGITVVFSSGTDCFTKTASATAFFSMEVK